MDQFNGIVDKNKNLQRNVYKRPVFSDAELQKASVDDNIKLQILNSYVKAESDLCQNYKDKDLEHTRNSYHGHLWNLGYAQNVYIAKNADEESIVEQFGQIGFEGALKEFAESTPGLNDEEKNYYYDNELEEYGLNIPGFSGSFLIGFHGYHLSLHTEGAAASFINFAPNIINKEMAKGWIFFLNQEQWPLIWQTVDELNKQAIDLGLCIAENAESIDDFLRCPMQHGHKAETFLLIKYLNDRHSIKGTVDIQFKNEGYAGNGNVPHTVFVISEIFIAEAANGLRMCINSIVQRESLKHSIAFDDVCNQCETASETIAWYKHNMNETGKKLLVSVLKEGRDQLNRRIFSTLYPHNDVLCEIFIEWIYAEIYAKKFGLWSHANLCKDVCLQYAYDDVLPIYDAYKDEPNITLFVQEVLRKQQESSVIIISISQFLRHTFGPLPANSYISALSYVYEYWKTSQTIFINHIPSSFNQFIKDKATNHCVSMNEQFILHPSYYSYVNDPIFKISDNFARPLPFPMLITQNMDVDQSEMCESVASDIEMDDGKKPKNDTNMDDSGTKLSFIVHFLSHSPQIKYFQPTMTMVMIIMATHCLRKRKKRIKWTKVISSFA